MTWRTLYIHMKRALPDVVQMTFPELPDFFRCEMLLLAWFIPYTKLSGPSQAPLNRVLVVQCCPKSIKTTLHRNFSYVKLSGASWATLHRVLTCAMLSQEYYDKITGFFLCNIVWGLSDNIAEIFYLCIVASRVLRQNYTRLQFIQCCLEPSHTTLHMVLTCPMLSQEY